MGSFSFSVGTPDYKRMTIHSFISQGNSEVFGDVNFYGLHNSLPPALFTLLPNVSSLHIHSLSLLVPFNHSYHRPIVTMRRENVLSETFPLLI